MAQTSLDYILAIELSEHAVKLLQRSLATQTIDVVHSEPLSPEHFSNAAYLADVFKKIIKQYKRQLKTRNAVVSIPSYMSLVAVVPIDPEDADVYGQIEWEIEQQSVGKPSNSLNFDYTELPEYSSVATAAAVSDTATGDVSSPATPDQETHKYYLAAGTSREKIELLVNALKKAKIRPLIMDVDIFALANIFEHSYPEDQSEFVGIIHATADKITAILVKNGSYVDNFIRIVVNPSDGAGIKRLGASIQQEFETRTSKSAAGGTIRKIMLSGENILNESYRDALSSGFSKPVEILDPFRHMTIQAKIEKDVSRLGPAFAVVAGLSLRTMGELGDG